jgi:hypothetical protein
MEVPQARMTLFPVFPVDVLSLFLDSGNKLKRFPVVSVFAIRTVPSVCSTAFLTGQEHWEHRERTRAEELPPPKTWNSRGTTGNSSQRGRLRQDIGARLGLVELTIPQSGSPMDGRVNRTDKPCLPGQIRQAANLCSWESAFSKLSLQARQRQAHGTASNRRDAMGSSQSTQSPYVPSSTRAIAARRSRDREALRLSPRLAISHSRIFWFVSSGSAVMLTAIESRQPVGFANSRSLASRWCFVSCEFRCMISSNAAESMQLPCQLATRGFRELFPPDIDLRVAQPLLRARSAPISPRIRCALKEPTIWPG